MMLAGVCVEDYLLRRAQTWNATGNLPTRPLSRSVQVANIYQYTVAAVIILYYPPLSPILTFFY